MRTKITMELMLLLALGLVLPGAAIAQEWSKFFSEQDQFIVNFPGEPEVAAVDYVTESGVTIPSRVYSVDDGSSRFAIKVVDYTAAEQAHIDQCRRMEQENQRISPNQCRGRGHLRDIDGSIAYEAWNIRSQTDGEITYDAFGRIDGVPGLQIQIRHPDGSRSFIGIYMHERRLYVLDGRVPGSAPPPGLFQQSLGILDEENRRVRFQGDSEGNYSRVQTAYEYVGDEDPVTGEPISEFTPNDDGRIRNPGERTGRWVPEDDRKDLTFLATSFANSDVFERIDEPGLSATDMTRARAALIEYLRVCEFAWLQHKAGVFDITTFESYLDPAADIFASARVQAEWRNGLYSGDPEFMTYMGNWLSELASNP